MAENDLIAVTGASGFSGKYITTRLLAMGKRVKSLTGHPERPSPFGDRVSAVPFNFDKPEELTKSLEGATVLFNTYWIRFAYKDMTFERAVENSRALIRAAKDAGVRRIVHVSIANPSDDSPLPYYKGKADVERAIRESGLSYAILRPTVLFGPEDILINNIAFFLRKYPAFIVPGNGEYGMQPIFVEDFADILVGAAQTDENMVADAAGPETFTFNELLRLIREIVRCRARVVHLNAGLAVALVKLLGTFVGDVVLTDNEVKGLMANLLVSHEEPKGRVRLGDWLREHAETVGTEYHSELARHYR
ncbi:MAG: NAD(P)H-binding protein [Armatimonadota bacterium]|nr:NAD(P)H-binding protein [Armatimonadota bacterium]